MVTRIFDNPAPYHPEGNGAAERHVRPRLTKTLMFKLASGDLTHWERLPSAVQYGLNARISARHKSTPFSLMFGRKLHALTDYTGTTSDLLSEEELVNRALTLTQVVYPITSSAEDYNAKMVKSFSDSKKIISDFKPGDRVMMKNLNKTQKGDELFVGPYTVVEHKGRGTYTLNWVTECQFLLYLSHLLLFFNRNQ